MTAGTGFGGCQIDACCVAYTVMLPHAIRTNVTYRCAAIRWGVMTRDAVCGVGVRAYRMAFKAASPSAFSIVQIYAVQIRAMTEGAGIMNVSCTVMTWASWPFLWVGTVLTMTTFAATAIGCVDPDIESWAAARAAEFAMARLTVSQVCLGIRTVVGAFVVSSV